MSIATNRAERQQMRQRGAANRKVKDVDFGFSFGHPQLSPKQPTEATSASLTIPPPPQISPPHASTPKKLSRPSTPGSRGSLARRRKTSPNIKTPGGSSGRVIPSPTSVYDIPPDDEPQSRSTKRRRISFRQTALSSSPRNKVLTPTPLVEETRESIEEQQRQTVLSIASPLTHTPGGPLPTDARLSSQIQSPTPAPFPPENLTQEVVATGVEKSNSAQERRTSTTRNKRKKRKSVLLPPKKHKKKGNVELNRPTEVVESLTNADSTEQADEIPSTTKRRSKRRTISPIEEEQAATIEVLAPSPERGEEEPSRSTPAEPESIDSQEQVQSKLKFARRAGDGKQNGRKKDVQALDSNTTQEAGVAESIVPEQPTKPPERSKSKRVRKSRTQQKPGEANTARKHTIPVTVHRLCNVSALEAILVDTSDNSDKELPSPENANKAHKHLNRSGFNAADVLSQVCQETLQKTISVLESNIEQESNVTRAGEWKRKCRIVQEFGSELENALFDVSELWESNFALATRLKKEKKEVHSLRHRLLNLRQERENIALQIDEVRSKYAEEQKARMDHESLNNSLHDLQLALERNHKRTDVDHHPFAGLEFLLRTVARDVSSSAPDSQGGLLKQVKHFNAQLERTVASLT